jgi:hypothetical protein
VGEADGRFHQMTKSRPQITIADLFERMAVCHLARLLKTLSLGAVPSLSLSGQDLVT